MFGHNAIVADMNRAEHNSVNMVRMENSDYGATGTMKLRYDNSPTRSPTSSYAKSSTKSPGGGISKRTWSPGQANLFRRRKVEGEAEVKESFNALSLADLHLDADDEDSDYLTKSLDAIENKSKTKQKRSGRRSNTPTSMRSRTPTKSKSLGGPSKMRKPLKGYSIGSDSDSSQGEPQPHRSYARSSRSNSPHATKNRRSARPVKSKSMDHRPLKSKSMDMYRAKPKGNQKDLPIEIQKRLYNVTDPNISIKKKVELELEFMKGTPEEKRIYLEYRNHFDRQEFLDWKDNDEQAKRENIEVVAREERLKEAAFQRELEAKRQKERQKEEESMERQRKAEEQARLHSLKTIASTMSDVKNSALEAATVSVARNQEAKLTYEEYRRQRVEQFRKKEGKNMHDVQRTLEEAMIEQEDPEEKRMLTKPTWKR